MWLVDHTYEVRAFADHSGVELTCEGVGGYRKRTLARLDNFAQDETYGLTRSTFVDWERSIFWKKGDYFVVLDRATADKDGDFFARCTFKALGEAEIRGKDLRLSQKDRFCKIVSDGGANVDIEESPYSDEQGWNTFYGHARPVATLFQQDKKRTLKRGESITFMNLLYAYPSREKERAVSMALVSETCALVMAGDSPTVFGVGEMPGGLGRADMFVITKEGVFAVGGTAPDVSLAPKALAAAKAEAEKRRQEAGASASRGPEVEGVTVETVKLDMPIRTMCVADIDGDGVEEWIVGGDSGVGVYETNGTKRWTFPTRAAVRAIDVGDLNGDGRPEIVFGCDDEKVRAVAAEGKEIWSFACKASHPSTSSNPAVDYVKIEDLDGDGKNEVVAGANWVHVLSGGGELKWERYMAFRRGRICGDFACGDVADINGDGKKEIIALFITSYPLMQVLNAEGKMILPAEGEQYGHEGINIDVPIDVAALDLFGGAKTREIIVCATRGGLSFFWPDHKPRENGGGRVTGSFAAMAHYQPSAAEPTTIIGANTLCGVMAIRPQPKGNDRWIKTDRAWYRTLDEKVSGLAAADLGGDGKGEVFVGTKAGNIHVLDLSGGVPKGHVLLGGAPVVTFARSAKTGAVIAAKGDGTVAVVTSR